MVTVQELESQRAEQEKVLQEPLPPRRFGAGVDVRRQQQEVILRQSIARDNLAIISRNREILDSQQSQAQEVQRQFDRGKRGRPANFGLARKNPEAYAAYVRGKETRMQDTAIQLNQIQRQDLQKQGLKPIESKGQIVGFEDTARGQSFSTTNIPVSAQSRLRTAGIKVSIVEQSIKNLTPEELYKEKLAEDYKNNPDKFEKESPKLSKFIKEKLIKEQGYGGKNITESGESKLIENKEENLSYLGKLNKRFKDKFLSGFDPDKVTEKLTGPELRPLETGEKRNVRELRARVTQGAVRAVLKDIKEKPVSNIALFGAGAAFKVVFTGAGVALSKFPKALKITNLFGRAGFVAAGAYGTAVTYQALTAAPDAESKSGVVVVAIKDAALFGAGFKAADVGTVKIIDYTRTFNLKEIPATQVIAPEFFKGQRYPAISRGQTAGQLRAEFYTKALPGEKRGIPRAFTASPSDFAKATKTGGGSSEVPGLFGAPRISASFFKLPKAPQDISPKISSFKSLLSQPGPFTLSKPTAVRLTLRDIEFAPGISSKTRIPTGKYPVSLFRSIQGTGRSVIPFAKTEKEVITAFDTPILQTGSTSFIKFQGRRIPIKSFKIDNGLLKKTAIPQQTLQQVTASSSGASYRPSSSNFLTSSLISSIRSTSRSSVLSSSKAFSSVTSSPRSSASSSSFSGISSSPPPISTTSSPPFSSIISSPGGGGSSSRPPSPPRRPPRPPRRPPRIPRRVSSSKNNFLSSLKGYKTLIKRKGKLFELPGITTKGRALFKGAREVTTGLGASFQIVASGTTSQNMDISFKPSNKIFREFRIKGRQRIATPLSFIQKTRQEGGARGGRLASRFEVRAIQQARRRKGQSIKGAVNLVI